MTDRTDDPDMMAWQRYRRERVVWCALAFAIFLLVVLMARGVA